MRLKKLTPVAIVEEIEPSLEFWEERLGFERLLEVHFEDQLGFVLLRRDGVDVMLQSAASIEDDLGILAQASRSTTCVIYIDVPDLDPILQACAGVEVAVGERKTFYGAREIYYREPGGHVVGFAAVEAPPKED